MKFIIDDGPGLDTGCTFRSGGPLTFDVLVTRYVGPIRSDGTLQNPGALVAAGLLSAKAKLVMPAYDVDYDAVPGPPYDPERDRVLFNGEELGFLNGLNNTWILNGFEIPIEKVRFPNRAPFGESPTPAHNTITIHIDTANQDVGEDVWCTSIDWAALSFKTISPIVLVHGNKEKPKYFDDAGFTAGLQSARWIHDGCKACENPINLRVNPIRTNGRELARKIPEIVKTFGADTYHLVMHSKGGLDSREFLANLPASHRGLTALSYTSLSTPQNGSILADLVIARDQIVDSKHHAEFKSFPTFTGTLVTLYGSDAGTKDLTTARAATFNARNIARLPTGTVFSTVGADADRNGNGRIDGNEGDGMTWANWIIDVPYQILRNTSAITVRYETRKDLLGRPHTIGVITSVPNATALGNDIAVTVPSAHGEGSLAPRVTNSATFSESAARNHTTVGDAGVAATVVSWILNVERTRGDLK